MPFAPANFFAIDTTSRRLASIRRFSASRSPFSLRFASSTSSSEVSSGTLPISLRYICIESMAARLARSILALSWACLDSRFFTSFLSLRSRYPPVPSTMRMPFCWSSSRKISYSNTYSSILGNRYKSSVSVTNPLVRPLPSIWSMRSRLGGVGGTGTAGFFGSLLTACGTCFFAPCICRLCGLKRSCFGGGFLAAGFLGIFTFFGGSSFFLVLPAGGFLNFCFKRPAACDFFAAADPLFFLSLLFLFGIELIELSVV